MIRRAEARVAAEESCRNSDPAVASNIALEPTETPCSRAELPISDEGLNGSPWP